MHGEEYKEDVDVFSKEKSGERNSEMPGFTELRWVEGKSLIIKGVDKDFEVACANLPAAT